MTIPEPTCRIGADAAGRGRGRMASYRLVRNLSASVVMSGHGPTPGLLLGAARVRPAASENDLEKIPAAGPVLIGIGAPYGALEALAVSVLLDGIRPDVKVTADHFVATAPNLRPRFLACDPWTGRRAAAANLRALRHGFEWLRSGGLLAAFVDGADGWTAAVRLARLAGSAVVPAVAVRRQVELPECGAIELRFGAPLSSARLSSFLLDSEAIGYLRWRTNVLGWRDQPALRLVPRPADGEPAAARC